MYLVRSWAEVSTGNYPIDAVVPKRSLPLCLERGDLYPYQSSHMTPTSHGS